MSKLSVAANHSRLLLPVIHFNDVYNLPSSNIEPSGGAARFHTAVQRALADFGQNDTTLEPLILFSGDALSPSTSVLILNIAVVIFLFEIPALLS